MITAAQWEKRIDSTIKYALTNGADIMKYISFKSNGEPIPDYEQMADDFSTNIRQSIAIGALVGGVCEMYSTLNKLKQGGSEWLND